MFSISNFLVILVIFLSVVCHAGKPVRIAVLDSPVDYTNPTLNPAMDFALLKSISVTLSSGEQVSLYDFNQRERTKFEEEIHADRLHEYAWFWNVISALNGPIHFRHL